VRPSAEKGLTIVSNTQKKPSPKIVYVDESGAVGSEYNADNHTDFERAPQLGT